MIQSRYSPSVVRHWVLVGLLLALAVAMAGCSDMESLRSYERSTDAVGDIFTFDVAEGTEQLRIVFSTQGPPASDGQALLLIELDESEDGEDDGDEIYYGSLGHGRSDEQLVQDPTPGHYEAILAFQGYTGPANVEIEVPSGSTTVGPRGVDLGENFWDILGVILAVVIATGGWFLYRHHTKRLDREIKRIDETFESLRSDAVDCREHLLQMEQEFQQQLVRNKLKEAHFMILEKRIERYLQDLKERLQSGELTEMPLELE